MKHLAATATALLATFLAGCLELEDANVSPEDLVQPEGIEGRWLVNMRVEHSFEEVAEVHATKDGFFEVSAIETGNDAAKLQRYVIGLIATPSEHIFIATIEFPDLGLTVLGTLVKQDGSWMLAGLRMNEDLAPAEAVEWLSKGYGLTYTKTAKAAVIEGTVDAETLRAITFGDRLAHRYFGPGGWSAEMTRLPEDHPHHARLDQALKLRALRRSDTVLSKVDVREDERLAAALDAAVLPLVESGETEAARVKLEGLVAGHELLTVKLERYRARIASISAQPGSSAFRAALEDGGVPALSGDERHALYWLSMLSVFRPGDDGCRFVPVLYLAALGGHAESQFQTGALLGRGNDCGWPQDLGESVHWYIEAGEQGHSDAQVNHAMAMLFGKGTGRDEAAAIDLLTRNAVESGNATAQYLLGVLNARGQVLAKSEPEAQKWLRMAAEQGYAPAQTQFGLLLREHGDTPAEWEEGRLWLGRAAEDGDAEGQYQLARLYTSGASGEYWRFGEAMKWLEAAAAQGHLKAQTALGLKYWEGDFRTHTMDTDYGKAVEWLGKAAARGDALAQTYLGYAYAGGDGVPEDDRLAIDWWMKAARQNESRAEEALGLAYEHGRGVSRDLREARRWYERAEIHGSMGAARKLGEGQFARLAQDDANFAVFLGLLALGIAAAVDAAAVDQEYVIEQSRAETVTGDSSDAADVPRCGQEHLVFPSKRPCGKHWRPWGQWKAKYWCWTDQNWERQGRIGVTFCTDGRNTDERSALLDPCNGTTGWCKGGFLE